MKDANLELHVAPSHLTRGLCLLSLLLAGCSPQAAQPTVTISERTPALAATSLPVELPEYLPKVWPSPGSVISLGEYAERINSNFFKYYLEEGGVGVRVHIDLVYEYFMGDEYGKVEYSAENTVIPEKHMELIVDGEIIPQDLLRVFDLLMETTITDQSGKLLFDGSSLLELAWGVPLEPGEHVASLVIYNADRVQILEYEWNFQIVGD